MVKILPAVLVSLKSCNMTSEAERFEDTIRRRVKVTEADLVGAIQALIRIQFIYRFYLCIPKSNCEVSSSVLIRWIYLEV